MSRAPTTRELGLFTASERAARRAQPRDTGGRFVRVDYSPTRLKILSVARQLCADLGLAPSPALPPFERQSP